MSKYFTTYRDLIGYKYSCLTKTKKTSNCASSVGKTHSFQFISSLQPANNSDWETAQT